MKRSVRFKVDIVLLFVGLFFSFYGFYWVFVGGFHSFDMAQNLIFIRDDFKIDLLEHNVSWFPMYFEVNTVGEVSSLEKTYQDGVKNVLIGVPILMSGMIVLGFALGGLVR